MTPDGPLRSAHDAPEASEAPEASAAAAEALAALLRGEGVRLATAQQTHALGVELGRSLRAGDLVLLTGDLAAGKTTLTQGIGVGLEVRGPITSPTFVIARVHPSLGTGPALVHVDAYRLGGLAELDDLDLDADLDDVVTVVEWGHGMAEALAEDRLELVLTRVLDAAEPAGTDARAHPVEADTVEPDTVEPDPVEPGPAQGAVAVVGDEARWVRAIGHGPRWQQRGQPT